MTETMLEIESWFCTRETLGINTGIPLTPTPLPVGTGRGAFETSRACFITVIECIDKNRARQVVPGTVQ